MVSVVLDVKVGVSLHVNWNANPQFSLQPRQTWVCLRQGGTFKWRELIRAALCFSNILHSFLCLRLNVWLVMKAISLPMVRWRMEVKQKGRLERKEACHCWQAGVCHLLLTGGGGVCASFPSEKLSSVVLLNLQLWSFPRDHSPLDLLS